MKPPSKKLYLIAALGLTIFTGCTTEPTENETMTLSEAIEIAKASQCAEKGTVGDEANFDQNNGDWLVDFTPSEAEQRPNCKSVCVVSTETQTAEASLICNEIIEAASQDDLIVVNGPLPNTQITSPLTIQGDARGQWYFEAQFPINLYDANNTLIASTNATAQGSWMTTNYVPFTATLQFSQPSTPTGTLVLEKANPSGEPQNAGQLVIPVQF